jgi:tyrosine-protein phosphatase SIW14
METKPQGNRFYEDCVQEEQDSDEELQPCENFNLVTPGVYRSAFPKKKNFKFLKKLKLKSILY